MVNKKNSLLVGSDGRLCWAYFASPTEDIEANSILREEMEETLHELFTKLEGSFPNGEIPPGRNPDVECIRLTLDPVNPEHRPLAFYFVLSLNFRADEGGLPPTTLCLNLFPRTWIHVL